MIICRTRDGVSRDFDGPPNQPNGDHCEEIKFSASEIWTITFRKYDGSPVFGEIHAVKLGVKE